MRQCPKCKTTEYNNRTMVMKVNECGHPLCANCVENLFVRNTYKCPNEKCGRMLMKKNFRDQLFDDPMIEREVFIRRRLSKIYNLHEDNFDSLRAFNDYLEHIEDIVSKLVHEIDAEQVEEEIHQFREKNTELIERNRRRLNADDIWVNQMLEEEAKRSKRLQAETNEENAKNGDAMANPRAIIDQLRQTDLPAEVILDRQRKLQIEAEMAEKEEAQRKKKIKLERQRASQVTTFGQVERKGKIYVHEAPHPALHGPRMPTLEEITNDGYLRYVRRTNRAETAGGYVPLVGCARALFESRQDLFSF